MSPELRRLLASLLDGMLTESEQVRLNDELRDHPDAQQQYREIMSLHALLYLDFSQGYRNLAPPLIEKQPLDFAKSHRQDTPPVEGGVADNVTRPLVERDGPPGTLQTSRGRNARIWSLLAVAASIAVLLAGWQWIGAGNEADLAGRRQSRAEWRAMQTRQGRAASAARSVAVLGEATGAQWSNADSTPNVGGGLSAGQFQLERGIVQLEFLSGAAVIVEGPAEFELVSADRLICRRGKMRAHVPAQAHGFRIETPNYAAVDLGTEFTVNVGSNGQSDFHVLDGEVELWDLKSAEQSPRETLTTGRSASATPGGVLAEVAIQKTLLVGSQQLRELSERAQQERFAAWRTFSSDLRSKPEVVLYYGLDGHGEWERELRNDGPNPDEVLTGAIVGCQWTSGRWTGKQALEFKRITDRVRLNVPGEFESLTYATWVRIEGLEQWLTSLMLTDGHDAQEVHWQITEQGALLLGVNDANSQLHDYFSPNVLGPRDLGRWVHLATVFDGSSGVVRHYLDAKQISSEQVKIPTRLRIGKAEIGNWAPNEQPGYRSRSLNGRVDEFIVFSAPLTGEQIREIYEAGKPGS